MAGRAGTTKIELIAEAPASLQEANERLREYREELNARQERELLLRRYEKTIETMQLGVTVTDLEGLIVDINPADATMHGYSVDELIGQNASIFADSERKDPLSEAELKDMTSWRREGVNLRKDGSRFPVQLRGRFKTLRRPSNDCQGHGQPKPRSPRDGPGGATHCEPDGDGILLRTREYRPIVDGRPMFARPTDPLVLAQLK